MFKRFDIVQTKQGRGRIERIDTTTYSIKMYVIGLLDGKKSDNDFTYVVKSENEITAV